MFWPGAVVTVTDAAAQALGRNAPPRSRPDDRLGGRSVVNNAVAPHSAAATSASTSGCGVTMALTYSCPKGAETVNRNVPSAGTATVWPAARAPSWESRLGYSSTTAPAGVRLTSVR